MSTSDTKKAIKNNIRTQLTALGYQLQDLSSDSDVDVTPLADVHYLGRLRGDNSGQGPLRSEAKFNIQLRFSAATPDELDIKNMEMETALEAAMTEENLNVGDLGVSNVTHEESVADSRNGEVGNLEYPITVRYRE